MLNRVIGTVVTLLGMIKFSHTVFAMPFAVLASFMAGDGGRGGFCGWSKFLLIVVCMVFARSAAMTFNRIVDARIDARNPRTAGRAIPGGRMGIGAAWLFFVICCVLFVGTTVLFWLPIGGWFGYLNAWPLILSVPTLVFICGYSYTKRFTRLSHFWLGASLMAAPVGAWVAVSPPSGPVTSIEVWILGVAVLLWVAGFDIIYACQDVDVDRREGLYSLPAKLGVGNALWVSRCCHSLCIATLLLLTHYSVLDSVFLAAVILTAVLFFIEHWLVRKGDMARIALVFGTINGMVSVVLAAAGILDVLH